jgi:hypothetical protein
MRLYCFVLYHIEQIENKARLLAELRVASNLGLDKSILLEDPFNYVRPVSVPAPVFLSVLSQ